MPDDADYATRIKDNIRTYFGPEDSASFVRIYHEPGGCCYLCGYEDIGRRFVVRNDSTGKEIELGRRCIFELNETMRAIEYRGEIDMKAVARAIVKLPGGRFKRRGPVSTDSIDDIQDEIMRERLGYTPDEIAPEGMGPSEIDWEE